MTTTSSALTGEPVSVLFVCLGNICRSTMAEGVFRHIANVDKPSQHPLIAEVDSCGTGAYHTGDSPDSRTMAVLAQNGLTSYKHKARKVKVPEDFAKFDYILAMDRANYDDLRSMARRARVSEEEMKKVHLYGEFGGQSKSEEIDDPYYGGKEGFNTAYEQATRFGKGLLKRIEEQAEAANQ